MSLVLRLSSTAATRVRFAVSELWETVLSLRLLQTGSPRPHHAAWVASVRERFDPERLKPLLALVPPSGFRADCLTGLAGTSRSTSPWT